MYGSLLSGLSEPVLRRAWLPLVKMKTAGISDINHWNPQTMSMSMTVLQMGRWKACKTRLRQSSVLRVCVLYPGQSGRWIRGGGRISRRSIRRTRLVTPLMLPQRRKEGLRVLPSCLVRSGLRDQRRFSVSVLYSGLQPQDVVFTINWPSESESWWWINREHLARESNSSSFR